MNDKSYCATYVDHNDTLISLASKLIKNNPLGNYVDNPNAMSSKLGSGHSILSYANNMDIKEPAIELSPHFYYRSLTQVLLVLHLGTCKGFAIEDIVSLEPSLLYGEREIFSTGCRLIGYDLVNDSESNNMDGSKGYLFANSTVILEVDVSKVSLVDFMISPFKEKIHLGFWKLNPGIKIGIKGLEVIVEGVPIHFDGADYGTYELPKMTNAISFNLKSKPFSRLIHRSEAVLGDNNGTWKKDAYYSNRAATGLTVRDQGRYEIVNLAMIYFENGGYNETDYTCDNHAGERTAHMHLSITNIDVGVGSSGIAAIKVHYIDGTSKIMGTNGNVSKWVSAKIPSNSIVVGLQGKETNSWGLVDLKVIYFVE